MSENQNQQTNDIVIVQSITPPKGNAKTGAVVGSDGTEYRVYPSMLGMVQVGGQYVFTYEENSFNGTLYKIVKYVKPRNPAGQNGTAQNPQGPQQTQAMPNIPSSRQSQPFVKGAVNDPTPERIFVCGGINAAIEGGQISVFNSRQVEDAVNTLRQAYNNTLAKPYAPYQISTGKPPASQELNDEIPF